MTKHRLDDNAPVLLIQPWCEYQESPQSDAGIHAERRMYTVKDVDDGDLVYELAVCRNGDDRWYYRRFHYPDGQWLPMPHHRDTYLDVMNRY